MGMERAMGIEPTLSAWKAEVLPLNYARFPENPMSEKLCLSDIGFPVFNLEGEGFEPSKA
jgi:hypothetical protein